jgi:hypothetical protein
MKRVILIIISYLIKKKIQFVFRSKNKKILSYLKRNNKLIEPPKSVISRHKQLWSRFDEHINCDSFRILSSISGIQDPYFVPEYIYYSEIEPRLNNSIMSAAYSDKNFYDLYYQNKLFPEVYIRSIEGILYDSNYKIIVNNPLKHFANKYVVAKKTLNTSGGLDVKFFRLNKNSFIDMSNNTKKEFEEVLHEFGPNFVFQEYIKQHEYFAQFNKSSINTVRILTYRSTINNKVFTVQSVLRIGQNGMRVDNQAAGGISSGIADSGKLNEYAVDKMGEIFFETNGIVFADVGIIPFINKMKKYAIEIGNKNFYSRLLGFDFCVDVNEKVRLLEINNSNLETNFLQMNNGPLFGDFTNEIITYCIKKQKSICLDFNI